MDFLEAYDAMVTRNEAQAEIFRQTSPDGHENWASFVSECGDHDEYQGKVVLCWLGW